MQALIEKIQNDPVLMLAAAVAAVVLLFVVLVVIVAAMRVKSYKDRFYNTRIDNEEKASMLETLQSELEHYKIRTAQNEQELQRFAETRDILEKTVKELEETRKELNETQNRLHATSAKLDQLRHQYETLKEEEQLLKERLEHVTEENNKLRINNARLLMKLENEERFGAKE